MQINSLLNLGFSSAGQAASPIAGLSLEASPLGKALSSFAGVIGLPKQGDGLLQINDPQGGIIPIPQIIGATTPLLAQVNAQQYIDIDAEAAIDQNVLQDVFKQNGQPAQVGIQNLADAYNISGEDYLDGKTFPVANEVANSESVEIDDATFEKQLALLQTDPQKTASDKSSVAANFTPIANASDADAKKAQDIYKNYLSSLDSVADQISDYADKKVAAASDAQQGGDSDQSQSRFGGAGQVLSFAQLEKANAQLSADFKNFDDRPIDINELGSQQKLVDASQSKLEAQIKHIETSQQVLKTPMEQIKVKISQGVELGQDKISIKLHPHELGKVDVEMNTDKDGKTQIRIVADRSETLDFLRRDSGELRHALRELGVHSDEAGMQFSLNQNPNSETQQNAFNNDSNSSNPRLAAQEYANHAPQNEVEYNYIMGSQGGLNIVV